MNKIAYSQDINKIVCSWDVGIKNLAYCILKNNKILEWNSINLSNTKYEKKKCDIKKCKKKMKYHYKIFNDNYFSSIFIV